MLVCMLVKCMLIILSFLLHELGHIIAIKIFGVTLQKIRFVGVGASILIDERSLNDNQKAVIYLSGPLMNIIFATIAHLISSSNYILYFTRINICIFIVNILPIIPLDGSKIIKIILERKLGMNKSKRMIIRLSNTCIVILGILGIIQIIKHKNFNILVVVIYINNIIREEIRMSNLKGMERILTRKERFLKKGIYPVRHIAVLNNGFVSDVLKNLDFDSIHIINILDKDLNLLAVINEEKLLNSLIEKGTGITFNDIKN